MTMVRRDLLRPAGAGLAGATLGAQAQTTTLPARVVPQMEQVIPNHPGLLTSLPADSLSAR
jgi:hypothetical protein